MRCYPGGVGAASEDHATRVDPRLLQANERTLLAWIRTGLALAAFGIVIDRLEVWLHTFCLPDASPSPSPPRAEAMWIAAAFIVLGTVANAVAIRRFLTVRRTILHGEEVGPDQFPVVFGVLLAALGGIVGAMLLLKAF
jgi:putative membrane protein